MYLLPGLIVPAAIIKQMAGCLPPAPSKNVYPLPKPSQGVYMCVQAS